jgi:hypothetical protein
MTRACASVVDARTVASLAPLRFFRFGDVGNLGQRRLQAPDAILGTASLSGPSPHVEGRVSGLPHHLFEMDTRLGHQVRERLLTPERARARAGAHASAVLGGAAEVYQILLHQQREHLRDERVDDLALLAAEIAERVVVDVHAAADPAVGVVQRRQSLDLSSAPFSFAGGVDPKREQDLRIDGWCSGDAVSRLDLRVERRQVESLDHRPDRPRRVILGQLRVQVDAAPGDL